MVNKEAFEDISQLITAFPELHNQRDWEAPPEKTGHCGTVRCIAGWATWWKAREMGLLTQKRQITDGEIREAVMRAVGADSPRHEAIGEKVLGLSYEEAQSLFRDLDDKRALARVESFIRTGADLPDNDDSWYM